MSGPDMSVVTGSIDFVTVVGAVLAVFASIIVVYVVNKGIAIILYAVKGRDDWSRWDSELDDLELYESYARLSDWDKQTNGIESFDDYRRLMG